MRFISLSLIVRSYNPRTKRHPGIHQQIVIPVVEGDYRVPIDDGATGDSNVPKRCGNDRGSPAGSRRQTLLWHCWPRPQHFQGRIDATEHRIEEVLEGVQIDLERRARRFEQAAEALAAALLLLVIAGIFFLIGSWLGIDQLLGPTWSSFLLAVVFGGLAAISLLILHRISQARNV